MHDNSNLKDANPAEMPIEQATKVELVINLKAGRASTRALTDTEA